MTYNNKKLVLIAMYLSLSIVMEYFKQFVPLLRMPLGGAIEFPLIILAVASLHLGVYLGGCLGLGFWFITAILGLTYPPITPIQYLLDYIIPSITVGFSALFMHQKLFRLHQVIKIELGIILMMVIRYVCNLISGAYFYFPNNTVAGSIPAWINSIAYNTSYNLATLIILMIIVPIIFQHKHLKKFFK